MLTLVGVTTKRIAGKTYTLAKETASRARAYNHARTQRRSGNNAQVQEVLTNFGTINYLVWARRKG